MQEGNVCLLPGRRRKVRIGQVRDGRLWRFLPGNGGGHTGFRRGIQAALVFPEAEPHFTPGTAFGVSVTKHTVLQDLDTACVYASLLGAEDDHGNVIPPISPVVLHPQQAFGGPVPVHIHPGQPRHAEGQVRVFCDTAGLEVGLQGRFSGITAEAVRAGSVKGPAVFQDLRDGRTGRFLPLRVQRLVQGHLSVILDRQGHGGQLRQLDRGGDLAQIPAAGYHILRRRIAFRPSSRPLLKKRRLHQLAVLQGDLVDKVAAHVAPVVGQAVFSRPGVEAGVAAGNVPQLRHSAIPVSIHRGVVSGLPQPIADQQLRHGILVDVIEDIPAADLSDLQLRGIGIIIRPLRVPQFFFPLTQVLQKGNVRPAPGLRRLRRFFLCRRRLFPAAGQQQAGRQGQQRPFPHKNTTSD